MVSKANEGVSSFIDKETQLQTNGKYGLIDNKSNLHRLKNLELCSKLDLHTFKVRGSYVDVDYLCDGKNQSANFKIGLFREVLVATTDIIKGEEITPVNAGLKKAAIDTSTRLPDYRNRLEAKRTIEFNSIILSRDTKAKPDVLSGDKVEIITKGTGFKIKKKVTALEDGFVGDTIKIYDQKEKLGIITRSGQKISINIID